MTLQKSAHFRVGQCFSPYPGHYSWAFAFSAILYPPHQQRSLRFACRYRQRVGLTLFRMNFRAGRTLPLRRRLIVHGGPDYKDHTSPHTVLVQACQHVWLVEDNGVYQKFTCIGRTRSSLAPLRLRGQISLCLAAWRAGYPAATLSPELHTELLPAPHVWVGNG